MYYNSHTICSNRCCNSRPWKPLPRAAFQAHFGKPNEFLLKLSRKLVIFAFILLFQPLNFSYSKAFTIWQTPIVLFRLFALKANIAYFSQIQHAGTSQALWVNMFGEQLNFRSLPITCILYSLFLYPVNKKCSCTLGLNLEHSCQIISILSIISPQIFNFTIHKVH